MRRAAILALLCSCAPASAESASCEDPPSLEKRDQGTKAMARRDYQVAIAALEEAVELDRDDHAAWYQLGLAYAGLKKHDDAAGVFERAVKLRGDVAMYQLAYGDARYRAAIDEAKDLFAKGRDLKRDEVLEQELDLAALDFEPARQALATAVKLEPRLHRAHYLLGKIALAAGDDAAAAAALTCALELAPREPGPYILLGPLYVRWGLLDEAVRVLAQGAEHVTSARDRGQVLYAYGMALVDKGDHARAIEQLSKALEADKNEDRARLERGLAYLSAGQLANAKRDLEEFVKRATYYPVLRSIAEQGLRAIQQEEP